MKNKSSFFCAKSFLSLCLFTFCVSLPNWTTVTVRAQQTSESAEALSAKAAALLKQQKFSEALPVLEKLIAVDPQNAYAHYYLGFALLSHSMTVADKNSRPALRVRARNEFVTAKKLDVPEPNVDALIQGLPVDGSEGKGFSENQAAHKLMEEGEAAFSRGQLDEALKSYKKALETDPKLYDAALYSGDVYLQKGDFANAEIWYQKAIAIDPNRETAYRYSATPLMKQNKYEQARDRYVEAYIVEPYSRFSRAGLTQWAQATNTQIGHPAIKIPTDVKFDEKGNSKINLDPTVLSDKNDGSAAWMMYGITRAFWHKDKFARTFAGEKQYRHSLAEEADALRSVISAATEKNKNDKNLDASIAVLKKLDAAGVLEAYILLAQPDEGIAQDHPQYLKQNRDKLRRYVIEYVVANNQK